MIQKKSIRLIDNWYLVDTLKNSLTVFNMNTRDDGTLRTGYGYLKPMKVNCKEGIIRQPKNYFTKFASLKRKNKPFYVMYQGFNRYLSDSGWFLTQNELDQGKIIKSNSRGNRREITQMHDASLFNYFCGD